MKKLLFISFTFATVISCKETSQKNESITETKESSDAEMQAMAEKAADSAANVVDYLATNGAEGENPKVYEAKRLIDQSTEWMIKGIKKEESNEKVNSKINLLMTQLNNLNSELSPADQEKVNSYRIEKAQEAIDLQIQYSK